MNSKMTLEEKRAIAVWIAHSLFERGRTGGNSANLSFLHEGKMYITATASCFGDLTGDGFACLSMEGQILDGRKPSKEWPLHLTVYRKKTGVEAVIHTHSINSILWSCLTHESEKDCIPPNTPYLQMKVGAVGLIPYERPGSRELFEAFDRNMDGSGAWILKRHGPVVPGGSLREAFYNLEELEESARIAWELKKAGIRL